MTASQTIDLMKATDISLSANKKYATSVNSATDFQNVFDSVSKNYSSNDTSATSAPKKEVKTETSNTQASKPKEKVEYKTEEENKVTDNSQQPKENKIDNKENNETNKTIENKETSTKEEVQVKDNKVVKNTPKSAIETVEKDKLEQKILDKKLSLDTELEKVLDNKLQLNSELNDKLSQDVDLKANIEKIANAKIDLANQDEAKAELDKNLSEILEVKAVTEIMTNLETPAVLEEQPVIAQEVLETQNLVNDLMKAENVSEISVKVALDSQVQAKQPIPLNQETANTVSNENVLQETNTLPKENIAKMDNSEILTDTKENRILVDTKIEEKAPLVKAESHVELQNIKTDDVKQNVKSALENANLNQENIDELNVEITSVETTGGEMQDFNSQTDSKSNFAQRQNVQDQAVRLEIQANSSFESEINLNANSEPVGQVANLNIEKTVNLSNMQPTQQMQAPREVQANDILSQINKQINAKAIQEQGTTKISMVLRPENLGKLELELVSSKTGLEAKMVASTPQVKEMLEKHLDALKETLSNQGVNVNNVTVKVQESQKSDTMFSFDQQQNQEQQAQQQAHKTKGEFKGGEVVDEDLDVELEEEQNTNSAQAEQTVAINGLNGRVDYKI